MSSARRLLTALLLVAPAGLAAQTAPRPDADPRIEKLVRGRTPVTVDTALRLERLFGPSAQFWLNLQTRYDLETAKAAPIAGIEAIEPLRV